MNHSQHNQSQQQNQHFYLDQQRQALLHSYLVKQQQILQQPTHSVTNTPPLPAMVIPTSGPPISNIVTQQQQVVQPVMPVSPTSLHAVSMLQDNRIVDDEAEPMPPRKRSFTKIFAIALIIALAVAIYVVWQPATTSLSASTTGVQNSTVSNVSNAGGSTSSTTGDIQVYVLGAVKTPGVYTLSSTARVVDLIKAAGGPLAKANLVALNMAAKLTDGEEVYVTLVGETPPTYMGGVPSLNGGNSTPVATVGAGGTAVTGGTTGTTTGQIININTASATDMMSNLHVSSKTAQAIIDYRTQNGNYTSVTQLLQVVSRSIYDKVRSQCTV